MTHFQTFKVFPFIPEPLSFLKDLSMNLWWCWDYQAVELFRRIDPRLWENEAERNPLKFLEIVPQERLEELAGNDSFLGHQKQVKERFEERILSIDCNRSLSEYQGWIAYFSMEFGLHESIPLFAGGLGILAGDHLKAASNMSLPLIGVGLLYSEGYFRQYLDQSGWQQETYPKNDLFYLPVHKIRDASGDAIRISVTGPEGEIIALVWKIQVGCVPLILLDTNLPENTPWARKITARLYSGDSRVRLAQEVLLGIGGMRALQAMNIFPTVCHMNEGHSAFAGLERLAQTMAAYKVNLQTALEIVPRTTIFTTHTPVAAGHDEFPVDLVRPYIRPLQERLTATEDDILSFGQPVGGSSKNMPISMFVLALSLAGYCNGVSKLHGDVARRMWAHLWPGRTENEIPITHVTNGVHSCSYVSRELTILFERYLGPDWYQHPFHAETIQRIDDIFDEELWHAHELQRASLIQTARKYISRQYSRLNAPMAVMQEVESVLDQNVLTICFARRFATYKRANLLLMDPDRLEALITSSSHPVQFVFAGKAHPKDHEGKELIRHLIAFADRPGVRHRMVFIEDYDIHIARHMVQGGDVWLNTPRRPFEACGTSGMKAAINGVLNVSILDGWWCEGYSETRGWQFGDGEDYEDRAYQDAVESQALYNVLENEVIPTFYTRKEGKPPTQWLQMMKESMKMALQDYCSHRMVREYNDRFYRPCAERLAQLVKDDAREAVSLVAQRRRLLNLWRHIQLEAPCKQIRSPFHVGDVFQVTSKVFLGELRPKEVDVELYYGPLESVDTLAGSCTEKMTVLEDYDKGLYLYQCNITCRNPGRYGFTSRVTPSGDKWIKFFPGLITWAHKA